MDKPKRILIIEDEKGLVMSLEDLLGSEGYYTEGRYDGKSGEDAVLRAADTGEEWDLIILDIMLPGKDGFQVCRDLRERGVTIPVLMLTARDTSLDTVTGLRSGADDYLSKPFDSNVLLARVHALLRRAELSDRSTRALREETGPKHFVFGEFILDRELKELKKGTVAVEINAQEYRLLEYLARHPDRVISRDELLDEVWGYGSVASTRTVDVHIARLRKKLGEEKQPRHIHTLRGHGYRFRGE
jgi:two-component system, OmpR family, alkaline phosphatase synthesis response regulator PhoP